MDFIRKIKKLYNLNSESSGRSESEIADAEYVLSVKIPPLLRRYYLEIGSLPAPEFAETPALLLSLNELFINDNYLVFYSGKHFGTEYFYILLDDLDKENPKIYMKNGYIYTEYLDEFIQNIAFRHAIYSLKYTNKWKIRDAWNSGHYLHEKAYETMVKQWTKIRLRRREMNKRNKKYTEYTNDTFYTIDYSEIIDEGDSGDHDVTIEYGTSYEDRYIAFKEKIEREMEGYIEEIC